MPKSTVCPNSERKENHNMKRIIAVLSAIIIVISLAACGTKTNNNPTEAPQTTASGNAAQTNQGGENEAPAEPVTLESGHTTLGDKKDYKYAFYLEVISKDGTNKKYGIYTKETTLGAALSAIGVIDGEDGPYGLMVESVFGEEHIYETTGYVWMVYVNGEQAQTGVDSINLESGATYTFKVETF